MFAIVSLTKIWQNKLRDPSQDGKEKKIFEKMVLKPVVFGL